MHLVPRPRAPEMVGRVFGAAWHWPVQSQQQSRRNAMIASTALAQRRAEIDEVDDYLAALGQARAMEVAAQAAHG